MTQVRYKLVLAKCQVTKVSRGELGTKFSVALPHGVTIEADLSIAPDVRVGDILTLYTEILSREQSGDKSTN